MRARLFTMAVVTAATLAIAPGATAATPQPVAIDVVLALSGNLEASTTRGSFSMSGANVDAGTEAGSGWFAGQGHLKTGDPNSLHSEIVLTGATGTITIELVGLFGQLPAPLAWAEGRWVVADGTGSYAGAHGRGAWTAVADFRDAIAHVGPPRVSFALEGTMN